MAKQTAVRIDSAESFKFVKKGDKISGYYLETSEITIDGRPVKRHLFQTPSGLVSVLGQYDMSKQLQDNNCLKLNVDITFTGNIQKLKGGKTMKLYEVAFDPEDVWSGSTESLDTSDSPVEEDESFDSEEEPVDEVSPARTARPARAASVPNAAEQARVKALFSRNTK